MVSPVVAMRQGVQDAEKLGQVMTGAADIQITMRNGLKVWTIATLNTKINLVQVRADQIIRDLNVLSANKENQINSVAKTATDQINNTKDQANLTISRALQDVIDAANQVQQRGDQAITELNDAINIAAAAGAGENGWTASLIDVGLGRNQAQINNDTINVKNFGAIGDNTLHKVQEWTVAGSAIYYANLAEIQADYPHITSLDDSIDWACIQKALNTGRHISGCYGYYILNKSLYYKTSRQNVSNLGVVKIDAALGKPCLHVGASDEAGTPHLVWKGDISGSVFVSLKDPNSSENNRAQNSCGINLVSCSQMTINVESRGFFAGLGISGKCYANTILTPTLIQNTYGVADLNTNADLQGSIFVGGRIEQNQKEGVRFASVNTTFSGTVIEGNGLWNGGDGSTPEVTLLSSVESGAVTFQGCYMESLDGKSARGIIEIAPNAVRHVFINGGHYFGGVDNKNNIVVVDIKSPASSVCSVQITGAYVNDVKNYARGVISGNSQVSILNCMPREPLAVWLDVTVGSGNPLIQQFDREYWYTNQNLRVKGIQSTGLIATSGAITAAETVTCKYPISTDANIGSTEFGNYLQSRQIVQTTPSNTPTCGLASLFPQGLIYKYNIDAVGRATASNGHVFEAVLTICNPNGVPQILHQKITSNSKESQDLVFAFDSNNNLIVSSNDGTLISYLYRFFIERRMQS